MGQPMGKTYEQNVTEMVSNGMIAMAYESSWEVGRNDLCQMWLGNPRKNRGFHESSTTGEFSNATLYS